MAKTRQIGDVVAAMAAALKAEPPRSTNARGGPVDMSLLVAALERIAAKAVFTAPEAMRGRWLEVEHVFHDAAFGTADPAGWDRAQAPKWSERAGRILVGKEG